LALGPIVEHFQVLAAVAALIAEGDLMTSIEIHTGRGPAQGQRPGRRPLRPILARAAKDAFLKLDPRKLTGNPVIFATWIVALLSTVSAIAAVANHQAAGFAIQVSLWLWATVLFANLAESVAEGRGKAAADSLRATRVTTPPS
jgi:K+-transporting ATPase ATPase B chain